MKNIFLSFIVLFSISFCYAQDLTGVWRGHFWQGSLHSNDNSVQQLISGDDRYKFEVQIAQDNKLFKAVTYSYLSTIFYGKAVAEGTLNPSSKKAVLRELKIVELKSMYGSACIMTCLLQYSKIGDAEFLEGTYTSMNNHDSSNCGKGTVFLRKVPSSDFYKEPFVEKREDEIAKNKPAMKEPDVKKDKAVASTNNKPTAPLKKPTATPAKPPIKKDNPVSRPSSTVKNNKAPATKNPLQHNPVKHDVASESMKPMQVDSVNPERKIIAPVITPKVLLNRQNQLVKTITVNTNEIELDIYDDGTIDNDTVSVYLDKKLVISHAMLTDRPIVMKVHLDDDNDYHEVVMVADNEGTIPPNTSLMIVKAGDKRYEVRIVSTEQKNATVVFKYEK